MTTTGTPASVGELTVLLTSWRRHLEAARLSPKTIRACTDDGALFARLLAVKGMATAVAMGRLRRNARDADVDLRADLVRVTAKGRREMVLPIG